MFSFIRKRLPSKDRNNEHIQNTTDEQLQDDPNRRTTLTNLKKKKKTKKKEIFSSVDNISDNSPINKPYSDVDYFPLMPGALSHPINQQRISTHSDISSDCYLNPSEIVQKTNGLNYVQTNRVMEIPVIDCREGQNLRNYNDVDHSRTRALRELTEERTQEKSIK